MVRSLSNCSRSAFSRAKRSWTLKVIWAWKPLELGLRASGGWDDEAHRVWKLAARGNLVGAMCAGARREARSSDVLLSWDMAGVKENGKELC